MKQLALEFLQVTLLAALAVKPWIGRGCKYAKCCGISRWMALSSSEKGTGRGTDAIHRRSSLHQFRNLTLLWIHWKGRHWLHRGKIIRYRCGTVGGGDCL